MKAVAIEGYILGFFVIINGIYVTYFPPYGDEPQGIAIIAIGLFIILATHHLAAITEKNEEPPLLP